MTAARSFLVDFAAVAAAAAATLLLALLLLDPYATGRVTPRALDIRVPFDTTPSKSSVAILRNEGFDAFVFGNSTLQTLDPQRLNALTGRSFAQVTVPGTGPMEQAAMLRYAARQRGAGVRAVILGLDMTWCDPRLAAASVNPFPFWLYADGFWGYLSGLFRFDNIEALPRRVRVLLGRERPSRPDGYWNYELHVPPRPYPFALPGSARREAAPHSAASALRRVLAGLPPEWRVVLATTPIYKPLENMGDFVSAYGLERCKEELIAAAATRSRTTIVDGWRDTPLNGRRENFLDAIHFRAPVARDIEAAAAAAIGGME